MNWLVVTALIVLATAIFAAATYGIAIGILMLLTAIVIVVLLYLRVMRG